MNQLTSETFDQAVSSGIAIVKFTGEGCGPCRMLQPVLEEMEKEMADIKFSEVEVFAQPTLADRFGIASIPQLVLFKDGKEQRRVVGFQPKSKLAEWLAG